MEAKAWYLSTTVWGIFLTALGLVLGFFNIDFTPEQQAIVKDGIIAIISTVVQLIGVITAIIGRKKAATVLTISGTAAKAHNEALKKAA